MGIPKSSLISYFSNKVKQNGGLNLAQGIPAFAPPKELIDIFRDETLKCTHQYPAGNGYLPLLKEIVKSYTEYANVQYNGKFITPDNLLITQGATEAVTLLYTYLNHIIGKFTTLAFEPVYESYEHLPEIFNQKFVTFPVLPEIDFERFEKTLYTQNVKLIFVNSPGNPLGKIWTKEEIDELLKRCLKYQVYVVLDTVYEEFYFEKSPYYASDKLNDYIFYVGSFSKMYCITAWRIGYLMFADKHIEAIRNIHDYTALCATEIHQRALAAYINRYQWGMSYIENIRQQIRDNYHDTKILLEKYGFQVTPIQGGCFLWVKLPEAYTDGFDFALKLYDNVQVAVVPGIHFDKKANCFIRINIARPKSELEEGVSLIIKFINSKI